MPSLDCPGCGQEGLAREGPRGPYVCPSDDEQCRVETYWPETEVVA